jgi:hypothetical protein
MFWPGFYPFTTSGLTDLFGVKYLTITVTIIDPVVGEVSYGLTCDSLNGTINDGVSGTTPPAGFISSFPAWPPDVVTDTHLGWGSGVGSVSVDLSDPIALSTIKDDCQALLDSLDVATVALNTEKRVRYNYDTSPPFEARISYDWPVWNVDSGTGTLYWMSVVSQAPFNTPSTPFAAVTAAMVTEDITTGPVSPTSESYYEQEDFWLMRKSFSSPVSGSTCCEDDAYFYINNPTPAPACQMIADDGMGHLRLDPPSLAPDTTDNAHAIIRTPYFGKSLTGGGCPCA